MLQFHFYSQHIIQFVVTTKLQSQKVNYRIQHIFGGGKPWQI